jgi:peptide/nickel transport system ATP-binding protein
MSSVYPLSCHSFSIDKNAVSHSNENRVTPDCAHDGPRRRPSCLRLENVAKHFGGGWKKKTHSLLFKDVSLTVSAGETVGIMGQSGVGKTTLGRIVAGLEKPTSGTVYFMEKDIAGLRNKEYRQYRRRVQMIFQDSEGSFNPRKTLRRSLMDVLKLIRCPAGDWEGVIDRSLNEVGLSRDVLDRFPYQLSGGMNQRSALARVLLLEPEFIVLDEPTSALDLTIQAQILSVLRQLKKNNKCSYILISHNKQVIESMSDRICILENGRLTVK